MFTVTIAPLSAYASLSWDTQSPEIYFLLQNKTHKCLLFVYASNSDGTFAAHSLCIDNFSIFSLSVFFVLYIVV